MNKHLKAYRSWIIISILSFVLILILQIVWLFRAIQVQEERKVLDVQQHVQSIALLLNNSNRSAFHGENYSLADRIELQEIDSLIEEYKNLHNISTPFHYSVYMDSLKEEFISDNLAFKKELLNSEIKSCLSCIVAFYTTENIEKNPGESDDSYSNRLMEHSEFQYYSPVKNIKKGKKSVWLSLFIPLSFSNTIKSFLALFLGSLALLCLQFYLFFYLLRSLNRHKKESQVKDDFFNNMTHEFKTPLSSIHLASRVLRQGNQDAKKESYFDLIEKESKSLEIQVDKILELSLLDNSSINLDKEDVDLCQLTKGIYAKIRPIVEHKSAKVSIQCLSENLIIKADSYHLSKSLINLIENSLKYGQQGVSINITIKKDGNNIKLITRDNGPGIDEEFRPYIFDRFYRGQKNNQYKGQGFGIGLSYVQFVVHAHQGVIKLNDSYKNGCEFIITF